MSLPVFAIKSFSGDDASLENKIEALRAQVSEIIHSISDEYDPTKTYTTGQLVTHEGKLYKALVDISTPEAWNPDHWEERDIEDEITRLTNEIASKYTKPEDGIPLTDLTQTVQESLALGATALQSESDPTVPNWAKQTIKPSYTWSEITDKPFNTIGENLKVVNGALSVDTAPNVQQDNTKPITSAAVYVEVGNINALLALI